MMIWKASSSGAPSIELCVEFERDTERISSGGYSRFRLVSEFGELPGRFRQPFDSSEAERALASASRLGGKAIQRSAGADSLNPLRELGQALFRAVFEGSVGEYFLKAWATAEQENRTLRLVLDLPDAELAALPWEYLVDKDFLALSRRCSIVRRPRHVSPVLPEPARPELSRPLRVLLAWADPTRVLESGLRVEHERLARIEGIEVKLVEHATRERLQDAVFAGGYDVLHFSGSAAEPSERGWPRRQFLALEPGRSPTSSESNDRPRAKDDLPYAPLDMRELASWFRGRPPTLAVFSACHTDWLAAELGRVVPFTIGVRGLATDPVCTAFSEGFYGALLRGESVEAALSAGRQQMDWTDPGKQLWGSIVAWWNLQDGRIFHGAAPPGAKIMETEDNLTIGNVVLPKRGTTAAQKSGSAGVLEPASASEFKRLKSLQALHEVNLQALEKLLGSFAEGPPQSLLEQRAEVQRQLDGIKEQLGRLNLPA